jgi:hypothetical protein
MRYNQKSDYTFLRLFVYLMGFALIAGMAIITYTIYKRNSIDFAQPICAPNEYPKIALPGAVKQILPMEANKVIIVTVNEEHNVSAYVYDYCSDQVLRRFNIVGRSPDVSGDLENAK